MERLISKKIFNKKKIPALCIVIICFGSSALFSILGLKTQGATQFSMFVFGALAVGGEIVKFYFPSTAIVSKDLHMGIRICFGIIGLWAMIYSITFSFAFSKNEANTLYNKFIQTSSEAKAQNKKVADRESLITRLKTELEDLKAEKKFEVNKWHPVTRKTKRQETIDKYSILISKKEAELTKEQKEGLKDTKPVKTNERINVGVTGLFDTVEQENLFFKSFALFMEIAGIFGLVDLRRKSVRILKQWVEDEDIEPSENTERSSNSEKKVIDMDSKKKERTITNKDQLPPLPVDDVDEEAVRLYAQEALKKLEQNPDDIACPGLTTLAKKLNYSREKLRKAKNYLEYKQALYVDGLTTYVNDISKLKMYA